MCHETPASIAPRIVALLAGETVPWTGNEILGRIAAGDVPCETHFDEAIRLLIREGKLSSGDSDPWAPNLTVTTRCRLAYTLVPDPKPPTAVVAPAPTPVPPKPPTVVAAPHPPPIPTAPALPSPAARLEAIGRLRDEKARVEREWTARFGPDCFRAGPPDFLRTLFLQARTHGLFPRLRDALEKALGRRIEDFERSCQNLLDLNDRDGTIPVGVIDSGVKLDLMSYVAMDLDRAERDVHEGREGSPVNAREILAFLKTAIDNPSLRKAPTVVEEKPARVVPAGDTLLGATFGPYKIVRTIGKGGMGAVYEGLDETLDRRVALKILHAQFADNREYQERFLREARNAANANLDHPNITQVYAAGREGPHLWLAMQLVRGRTLTRVLEERKKLPPEEALRIVRQVAEGLAVAHAAQMIHRDIKPDNLMLDDSGRLKIMDFGLMRSVDLKDGLTQDGLFVGTLEYASPEQCQDKTLDARTDLYSLGVVLYQLLSGARPYTARTAFGYLSMIPDPQQPPVPLRQQSPDVPPAVDALVHKLIAKKPDERFASAQELIRAIDALLQPAPRVDPAAPPARKAVASLVGWSVALVVAAVAAWLLWPKKAPSTTPPPPPIVKKDPDPPVKIDPPPVVQTPDVKPPLKDPALELLTSHAPTAQELEVLEQLLAVSRATLAARKSYWFEDASRQVLAFERGKSLTPWLELFVGAERDRMKAALEAFRTRPLLEGKDGLLIQLRDGRTMRGRVVSEVGVRLTVEAADGGREGLTLDRVSPSTFAPARGTTPDAVRVRSAASDAAGALPLLAGLGEAARRCLAPLVLDQAIEEILQGGDPKAIAGFEIPSELRATADALLPTRLKALALEKDAAWALLHVDEGESLQRLLTTYAGTRSGARAARETVDAFEKTLPADEKFELVSPAAWGTWDPDTRDAPGGTVVFDKAKSVYVLSAPSLKEQVRLLKKLKGAERGYRLRWSFGAGAADGAAFMVALSFTRWIEAGPRSLTLFRADGEKVSTARKAELPERLSGGVIHLLPRAGLVLVYLNGRLQFALPEKEYALGGGLQLGMSGGSATIESLRVLDRARD